MKCKFLLSIVPLISRKEIYSREISGGKINDEGNNKDKAVQPSQLRTLYKLFGFLCLLLLSQLSTAGDDIKINYQLQTQHGVDFSQLPRGPLKLGAITDKRQQFSGKQISANQSLNIAVTALLQQAIAQGFKQGGATLAAEQFKQELQGELRQFEIESIEKNGVQHLQVTIRANMQLNTGSNKSWQSLIQGRGDAPAEQGISAAIQTALDSFVSSLFFDDYLLIELVD